MAILWIACATGAALAWPQGREQSPVTFAGHTAPNGVVDAAAAVLFGSLISIRSMRRLRRWHSAWGGRLLSLLAWCALIASLATAPLVAAQSQKVVRLVVIGGHAFLARTVAVATGLLLLDAIIVALAAAGRSRVVPGFALLATLFAAGYWRWWPYDVAVPTSGVILATLTRVNSRITKRDTREALASYSYSPGEQPRFILGPGDPSAGIDASPHLLVTTDRISVVTKGGVFVKRYVTHPLVALRDLQTLSVVPSLEAGTQPHVRVGLRVNGHEPFTVTWPRPGEKRDVCFKVSGDPPQLEVWYPYNVVLEVLIEAERARGTLRSGPWGYPAAAAASIMLEPGERVVDCLFGYAQPADAGPQMGGVLLTDARAILYRRGWVSRLERAEQAPHVGIRFDDDGAYRLLKSKALDQLRTVSVGQHGAIPYLILDEDTVSTPTGNEVAGFADNLRRERAKFTSVDWAAVQPADPRARAVVCGTCGAPCGADDLYCATCGATVGAPKEAS